MRQLLLFDRKLILKDTVLIDDIIPNQDIISPQKTTIEVPLNDSFEIGNIAFLRDYENGKFKYLGVIQDVKKENSTKISMYPLINITDNSMFMAKLDGTIFNWVVSVFTMNFINTNDEELKLPLKFIDQSNNATLKIDNIKNGGNLFDTLLDIFLKSGVYVDFDIEFENGKATAILCIVKKSSNEVINIRYDNPLLIKEPSIDFSQAQGLNKIIYIPNVANKAHTESRAYYLYDDNTIVKKDTNNRINGVVQKIVEYNDEDYDKLTQMAEDELVGESYNHLITLNVVNNESFNFELYKRVKYTSKTRTFDTYVTHIENYNDVYKIVQLGVLRNRLTDKLKEIGNTVNDTTNKVNGSVNDVSVNTQGNLVVVKNNGTTIQLAVSGGGSSIVVDNALSTSSENPVQNKVITNELLNRLKVYPQDAYDLNTCVNAGIYPFSSGQNAPKDLKWGTCLVITYRQATGNTTSDFAGQIFIPSGDYGNRIFFRTSLSTTWNSWQEIDVEKLQTAFSDVSVDSKTGILTFTKLNGDIRTIDTLLEKVVTNFVYDTTTKDLVLTLEDGTQQRVPMTAFIDDYTGVNGDTITISISNDNKISATIKNGSITLAMLADSVKNLINSKVDKVEGKGLSSNDYTNDEKTKLAGIEAGAEVNVQPDWNATDSTADDFVKNKPTKLSQFNEDAEHRLVTDTEKSTWNNKVDKVAGKGLSTNDYTTTEKNKLAGIQEGAQVNPTKLPNPYSLKIKQDDTLIGEYDGSSGQSVNILTKNPEDPFNFRLSGEIEMTTGAYGEYKPLMQIKLKTGQIVKILTTNEIEGEIENFERVVVFDGNHITERKNIYMSRMLNGQPLSDLLYSSVIKGDKSLYSLAPIRYSENYNKVIKCSYEITSIMEIDVRFSNLSTDENSASGDYMTLNNIDTATYGFAGGHMAQTINGGAIGNGANSWTGFSGGYNSSVTSGGAVGEGAETLSGFAGGYNARTWDSRNQRIDAVQLGTGTNNLAKTLQVYDDNIYDANTHAFKIGRWKIMPNSNGDLEFIYS